MFSAIVVIVSVLLSHVALSSATPYAGTIAVPIDHFNASDTRTYENRYWINTTYYAKGGPVFLADGGEAGLSDAAATSSLTEAGTFSAQMELARTYHGIALLWEHRFYGGSLPFELDNVTGVALDGYNAYKYLNNEQALEDIVYLATNFKPPGYEDGSLSASSTPWIFIGGSYPGARAAIIRVRNPDIVFASWSSSGVVEAQDNYSDWWNPIFQSIPSNCSADTHAAVTYADNILASGTAEEVSLLKRPSGSPKQQTQEMEASVLPIPTTPRT